MADDTVAKTLTCLLANQSKRREHALKDLTEDVMMQSPGGDCKSIYQILGHIVGLYHFQMKLLGESDDSMPNPDNLKTLDEINLALADAERIIVDAINRHDPEDWFSMPEVEREGPWSDEPTLVRVSRPINDVTNHLGGIRAIRRILGCPATTSF